MPDGRHQYKPFVEIHSTLILWGKDDTTEIGGNGFIYYIPGNKQRFVSPDCHVAYNLSMAAMESLEKNDTYLMWEVGKAPDFVLEIASPSTGRYDETGKRALYAELGVVEYWRYDPTVGEYYREPLVGEYLVDGEYQRLEMSREAVGLIRVHSPVLNLDLYWDDGRLRFYDPVAGGWLESHAEVAARAESEQAAREFAEARAKSEQAAREFAEARAESAEARLAEMKAELRRLRGE